jgi:hypothetical protein
MIEKFTFENDGQAYQCEREAIGKGELQQIIRVIGMGSKKDSHFMGRVSIQRQQWLSQRNESLGKLSKTINDR